MDTEKTDAGKPLILVVDDTPSAIHVLSEMLRRDYRVKVAVDGRTALELAAQEDKPDLVLLDIMMPEMDGYEVCRALKADPQTTEIPVVFVTALGEDAQHSRGLSLGAVDYITKPFSPDIVLLRVRTQVELKRQRDMLVALVTELQEALATVKILSGLIPICSWCKKIRDDQGYWTQLETYLRSHSAAEFSHGICPECLKKQYPEYAEDDEHRET